MHHKMLALSPPLFSSMGWPLELEDHQKSSHYEHNYLYRDMCTDQTADSFPHDHFIPSSTHPPQFELHDHSASTAAATPTISGGGGGGDDSGVSTITKKLYHNASERERRKKINNLYSTLRSLLPTDKAKKLSIPNTISRVLKYIPEIQKQVDGLIRRREELLSRISKQGDESLDEDGNKDEKMTMKSTAAAAGSSLCAVSTYRLNEREVAIQISTYNNDKTHNNLLSDILQQLEEEGLQVQNASSFESSAGRLFHNLHLHVERSYRFECENLSEKLKYLYE